MASFSAGTTFTDGVANDVTAAKLAALVNAATPTSGLIQDRTAETTIASNDTLLVGDASDSNNLKRMTVANFRSAATFGTTTSTAATITSGTITTLNSTTGTITTGVIPTLTSTTLITTGTGTAASPAIVPTGDSNTGVFFPAADTIAFAEGGTEAMRIDSSGNVIISSNKSLISNGAGGLASNTSIGSSALSSNTTGDNNTASGVNALYSNTTGVYNTASGVQALFSNTTGNYNTASGVNALYSNTTGVSNTASGFEALFYNTTGDNNTASGFRALLYNTTGDYNTASGFQALYSNTTGVSNTASGVQALYSNTTGVNNTASGVQALFSNTTGDNNTAIGLRAGYGSGTAANTTGSNNTFIGFEAEGTSGTASNVITLGNGSIATLRCQVQSISSLSDKRDKKDIENLSAGLDFVGKLRPVSFVWNTRDKAKVNIPDAGFIAQELLDVQEATGITIPNLVSQENPEKLEAAYGTLIPVLVQAIKELKAKVESLEEKNK